MVETVTPIAGLVLGVMLRPVPPATSPGSLPEWLASHTVAVSGGWIAARILAGSGHPLGLTNTSLVLGPLCYGVVSGLVMLTVVRQRPVEPTPIV